jgi:hypothetical protein
MDSAKLNDWMQIGGIFALVASLVFVGLQLKQSQDIAIAAQYHERAALAVEYFSTQFETNTLPNWGRVTGQQPTPELPIEELGIRWLHGASYLTMADNHYYQYQAGFLEKESWQAQRRTLKQNLANPNSPVHITLGTANTPYRAAFLALIDELTAEIGIESK